MSSAISAGQATVISCLRYRNAVQAIKWLCEAFGFEEHLVVPGDNDTIAHAQLRFGSGMIMLGSARDDDFGRFVKPMDGTDAPTTQSCYVIVPDVDGHCEKARAAGARIVSEPEDQDYGGRLYSCRDVEGHVWSFGSYDPWADVTE